MIDGDWLARLPGPKLLGQAANLEIVAGVSIVVLTLKAICKQNSLLSGGAEFFSLKAFNKLNEASPHCKG